jgi:C-terminal processing protease CtpA/Prc
MGEPPLQDKDCGSSGESTIDFFEYFPNVTKIGFNTVGMIHFGNVGLPNSGLHIKMPTKANKYKDGRFIEFTGIEPDILLEDGQDAYEHALKLIE